MFLQECDKIKFPQPADIISLACKAFKFAAKGKKLADAMASVHCCFRFHKAVTSEKLERIIFLVHPSVCKAEHDLQG